MNKILTNESGLFYDNAVTTNVVMELQTLPIQTADNRHIMILADFLRPVVDSYVQAKAKGCRARIRLSECLNHRTPLFKQKCLSGLLLISNGVKQMTDTIINSLYSRYQQLKAVSGTDTREMFVVLDKLVNTQITTPEDRKIKFSVGCDYVELFNLLATE